MGLLLLYVLRCVSLLDGRELPPPRVDRVQLRQAMQTLPKKPTLIQFQKSAKQRSRVDPKAAYRWVKRVRRSAWLPTLQASVDHRVNHGWDLGQKSGSPDALSSDLGSVQNYRIRATWELDRLLFNPDETRAMRSQMDVVDWHRQLMIEVTHLYFEHQRILLEWMLLETMTPEDTIKSTIRLLELEGLLEGITGLQFEQPALLQWNKK